MLMEQSYNLKENYVFVDLNVSTYNLFYLNSNNLENDLFFGTFSSSTKLSNESH